MLHNQVIVIGAGAGGMMAAGRAAEKGAQVILLEKMPKPGNKLRIAGQKRCNVTNTKPLDEFIVMFGSNGRFLYGAFKQYFRDDLLQFLAGYGVKAKVEPDGRIFPASDDARDVVKALQEYLSDCNVQLQTDMKVAEIRTERKRVAGVQTDRGILECDAAILASGGATYPSTGSSGDGYRMAEALGHTIIKLRPALVPLVVRETDVVKSMQGVSLNNVHLTAYRRSKNNITHSMAPTYDTGRGIEGKQPRPPVIESRRGDMMITHFGVSGPVTLLMSLAIVDALEQGEVSVAIDLLPDLSERQPNELLLRECGRSGKRSISTILGNLLPRKMIAPFLEMTGILPDKAGNQITAEEREGLVRLMKSLCFTIEGPLSMDSAMVTAGGISLDEIDPQTMESRLVKGLFFCGEVMDIDAETGGYNLQAAFSTGYVAGENAAARLHHKT